MNQAELRQMAEERILDAQALLNAGRWAFAYNVAGYAVECALKSCILARMVHTGSIFKEENENKKLKELFLIHSLELLVQRAGLWDMLNDFLRTNAGSPFVGYWGTVKAWDVNSRYQNRTETEARQLVEAICHQPHGVMLWIRNYW